MYEKIKLICKSKKVTISQLERDLGFAKGYISKLNNSSPSFERVQKIADYLNVSIKNFIE